MKLVNLIVFVLFLSFVLAVDCPYGHDDEPYPGNCGRYNDENSDGLCDLSQETSVVEEENYSNPQKISFKYPFVLISLLTIGSYLLSFVLWKKNKIGVVLHKKIWNFVLLVSFILSGILGLVLVLKINYGWFLGWNIMKLHVNAGIVLAWISLFHILEHLSYWKSYFK